MTTINPTNVATPDQIKGWELRQEDTGWGRALAHMLPVYPLIYGLQRNTYTPLLHCMLGNFFLGVLFVLATPTMAENKQEQYATLLSFAATPLLAKKGIEQARKYGELKLNQ